MIEVELADSYVIKGRMLSVRVLHPQVLKYGQLQVEVFDVGVSNPIARLGFGTVPTAVSEHVAQVEINSEHLSPGVYEIGLIRLHSSSDSDLAPQLDFISGRDFARKLFEVGYSIDSRRTAELLLTSVQQCEAELEREFLTSVDIRAAKTSETLDCFVLVFVRDMLVGTRMRFKHFEILPTKSGLDSRDALDFVNHFLRERTLVKVQFDYTDGAANHSRHSNPVCIVHFPAILATSMDEARDYCIGQTNRLLLALSLSRDAAGTVFEVVVFDRNKNRAEKSSISSPYVGNMLTGHLSGESADSLEAYIGGLVRDPINMLLTGLYKEARRDRSPDFQYVRFCQILEIMADSNNYDPASPLLDYNGNVMMDGDKPRRSGDGVNPVFCLLRDNEIGSTTETWKKINIWFAFRHAVAHYGSVSGYPALSRAAVRAWAELGYEEMKTAGRDIFLWELKEDTKLLLMRRLVGNQLA